MRTARLRVLVIAAVLALPLGAAQKDTRADAQFQAAINKETVEGDLKAAIEEYRKLAQSANRTVAAQALVRMGQCYEKLGDTEARKAYERVVRDFIDQKEAVSMARARLAGNELAGRTAGIAVRKVWSAPLESDITGSVSPDGRLIPYVDWNNFGDLFVHDLGTNVNRRITNSARNNKNGMVDESAEDSSFSKDGRLLAYSWFKSVDRTYELRVVSLQGAGVPQPRRLVGNKDLSWIAPYDWSPDGKWIAVRLQRKDRSTHIGLASVEDGSLRVLRSVDQRFYSRLVFSSDGRYLAYDLPANEESEQRDIFLWTMDGAREIPVIVHPGNDELVGWSPDGKRLLFSSNRGGSLGIWAQSLEDGNPRGTPELLKPDIGLQYPLGLSTSGALYSAEYHGNRDIWLADLDFATGKFLSPPAAPIAAFVGSNGAPDWSPDGRYLAYESMRGAAGSLRFVVAIRSSETGQVRELPLSPDGRYIATATRPLNSANKITSVLLVPVAGGESTELLRVDQPQIAVLCRWAPDSRSVIVGKGESAAGHPSEIWIISLEGQRRKLDADFGMNMRPFRLHPDGRHIAVEVNGPQKPVEVWVLENFPPTIHAGK